MPFLALPWHAPIESFLPQYTEFVLVHTKAYRFPFEEECEQREDDDYDVTLLVSHDTSGSPNEVDSYDTLNLKFYVILTCRRWVVTIKAFLLWNYTQKWNFGRIWGEKR